MAVLAWDDSMRVGVTDIDLQHQELVRLIGSLNSAMADGSSHRVMQETLSRLVDYTRTHFATEERLLERYGYAEIALHKAQHEEFVAKVEDFSRGFEEERLFLSLEVMDFLSDWLRGHIMGSDQRYASFLHQHGVS